MGGGLNLLLEFTQINHDNRNIRVWTTDVKRIGK